jgi:hypothetical protein
VVAGSSNLNIELFCVDVGVEALKVSIRGDYTSLERKDRFNDTRNSAASFQMPDVGLHGASVSLSELSTLHTRCFLT